MIKISVEKKNDLIDNITIKGHSGYSESGSDIVCSAVSSIAITSINAIISLDSKALEYVEKEGFLDVKVLKHTDTIDVLLYNMIDLLEDLSNQYSEFIKIK